MIDADALRQFGADMAAAFDRLANSLATAPDQSRAGPRTDVSLLLRGSRQRAVFKYLLMVGDDGATTAQINASISYDFSNTYTTVHRLKKLGFIELVPGVSPQTWRVVPRYRGKA